MFEVQSYRKKYKVSFTDIQDIPKIENSIAIIDRNVYNLYKDSLVGKFDYLCTVEATESNKTLDKCITLLDYLCRRQEVKKDTLLVAVGGGITQDITSFIASILYRGISWSFIPTTLLAQADSCIGSKTSINHRGVKNLVGSFYPPDNIWCDPKFLNSLEDSDIDSGIGEMLHYFMLCDSDYLDKIDKEDLAGAIAESLRIKKDMIEKDEFDENERRIFNYGHTFGHAIESLSDYSVKHGLAVTLGMHIANYVSYRLGFIPKDTLDYLQSKIEFNLPAFEMEDLDGYISNLLKDKKNVGRQLVCILPYGVADYRVTHIEDIDNLSSILEEYFDERKQKQQVQHSN